MEQIYNSIIEALIFSSDEPISAAEIIRSINGIDGDDIQVSSSEIADCITLLNKKYEENNISFRIINIANGYIFASDKEYAKYIGFLSSEKSKRRLSQVALETLAIIAYKQPVTKPELETIRGVNSDYIVNMLLERKLITITGRAESVGRPLLYGTTDEFLKYFALNKITDLPKPRELTEIMQDEDFLEQKRRIMMNAIEESAEEETQKSEPENNETE